MIIRNMDISEIDKLTEGAREFFSESEAFHGEFCPEIFKVTWEFIYESNQGVIIVLDDNGEIAGAIGGMAVPDCITGILSATEMFWYTRKQHRGQGLRLLSAYEAWAKERGCKKVRMVHLYDLMPDKLRKLYEKRGYREIETTYEMGVD